MSISFEVQNVSVTFIECKGYKPVGEVPDLYVDRWLDKISSLYEYARKHRMEKPQDRFRILVHGRAF